MVALGQVVADTEVAQHAGRVLGGVPVGQQLAHDLTDRVHVLAGEPQLDRRAGVARQLLADRVAFGVIGVQQALGRPPADRRRQLPAQVHRVLDAHAQPLRHGRGLHVRRVARQEHPPAPVLGGGPRGVGEAAHPAAPAVVEGLAGEPLPGVGEVGEGQRVAVVRRRRTGLVDDDPGDAVLQVHRHHHAAARQVLADAPLAGVHTGDVGREEAAPAVGAGEADPGQFADGAASAVAAHQVGGALPGRPVGPVHGHHDTVVALPHTGHLPAAQDRYAEFAHPVLQHPLGAELGDPPVPVVVLRQHAEVDRDPAEVAVGGLGAAETAEQAPLVEALGGALGEARPARLARRGGQPLVDDDVRAAEPEFARRHQPDRAGPDDDDIPGHVFAPLRWVAPGAHRPAYCGTPPPNQRSRAWPRSSVVPGEVQAT